MKKVFNISAVCKPELHYMVDIRNRLENMKVLIDKGEYFTVNRARQYGKTTMLHALSKFLKEEYLVVSLDFQKLGEAKFRNEKVFSEAFARVFVRAIRQVKMIQTNILQQAIDALEQAVQKKNNRVELLELFFYLSDICAAAKQPVVLIIDEVDSATNNQVFLDFLAQLRAYFIDRENTKTFQSVILAGVYDIRNLKRKLRPEESHKVNSPWNIAVNFDVEMSFSAKEIQGMLDCYEADHQIGMNTGQIADLIYDYTSGYPFLVSKICKWIDEVLIGSELCPDSRKAWSLFGVREAVKVLMVEKNTLFDSLLNKLNEYPELNPILYSILFCGKKIVFNPDDTAIEMAFLFGFIKNQDGYVAVANRIFETRLYNLFLISNEMQKNELFKAALQDRNQFIQHGHLNMELVLEKFILHFDELYGDCSDSFKEEDGRRFFLLYLRPIINGTGNYYIEARTRNMERTDVIVDYHGEQFVIEMKIWHGNAYNERGEEQLVGYLEHYHLKKGYMLSFNFNQKKQIGLHQIEMGDKLLIEAVV